jgi:DmsE family decaheme c-type cytochrome
LLALGACAAAVPACAASPGTAATPVTSPTSQKPSQVQAAVPATYVGDPACEGCHQAATHEFNQTMMGKVLLEHPRDEVEKHGCESCHGPGSRYVPAMAQAMGRGAKPDEFMHGPSKDGVVSFRTDSGESAELQNGECLNCHNNGAQAFWRAGTHAFRGVRCTDCHTLMRKISPRYQLAAAMESSPFMIIRPETQVCLHCHLKQKMEMTLPSHMPVFEGLMSCTDCHNPHGGPYPDQLIRATVNQTCYMCHAEKRGPFLWIHPPVTQNCLNCHDPHGSINRAMLRLRPPRLCQQCHIGTFHPGSPGAPGSVLVFSRSCTNCHSAIHGSNAPGGVYLTR